MNSDEKDLLRSFVEAHAKNDVDVKEQLKTLSARVSTVVDTIGVIASNMKSLQSAIDVGFPAVTSGLDALCEQLSDGPDQLPMKPAHQPLKSQPSTPPSSTPWRQSKNPTILWCPEQDADPADVERAKAKEGNMWYLAPRQGYSTGSIMKRK